MNEKKNERPVVAAFDFDGTLTYRDTLSSFLLYAAGPLRTFLYLLIQLPILVAFAAGRATRQETKERVLKQFFSGASIDKLRQMGEAFVRERLSRHLRPEAMQRLQWHREQGHRCVLVSASLDVYLEPWAESVGMDVALTSRVAFDGEGKVTGKLVGLNCRREEKVRRLRELLGPLEKYQIYAYGDSKGDKEMLEIADHPYYRKMPTEG